MTREEAIKRAEIAMAWARGEDVEYRTERDKVWTPAVLRHDDDRNGSGPPFFSDHMEWRIKPKPLECWVWWNLIDSKWQPSSYRSTEHFRPMREPTPCGRWVRMREVSE